MSAPTRTFLPLALAVILLGPVRSADAAFLFATPDAPLPGVAGTGLNGEVWAGVNVDSLAAAQAFIGANAPTATFTSTTVDYPKGSGNAISTSVNFGALLGTDAASLSVDITATQILNSILRFSGFIAVASAGTEPFAVGSDDGSRLSIQGTTVLDNDGIHAFPGAGAGPVDVTFEQAGLYEMEILFFESQVVQYGIEFASSAAFGPGDVIPTDRLFTSAVAVSEPDSLALMLAGLLGCFLVAKLAKRRGRTRHSSGIAW